MRLRIGMLAAAFLVGLLAIGAVASPGGVAAEEPRGSGENVRPAFAGDPPPGLRLWLRNSIVRCAALAMGLEVEEVKLGLRNGATLAELGIRAGVSPEQLEDGILRCERRHLAHLVSEGELEPGQARRIFNFVEKHITRIINRTWT